MAQTGSTGLFRVGGLLMRNGVVQITGTGAPVNGTTGAGVAGPGSLYFRTNGAIYANTNTKASPTWSQLGSVAALPDGKIFVGSAGGAAVAQTPSGDLTMTNLGAFTLSSTVIQKVSKALTAVNIKALNATPIEVLAAGGATKVHVVHGVLFEFKYGSVQMTGGGAVSLVMAGTHTAMHTGAVPAATVKAAASSYTWLGPLAGANGTALTANKALNIEADTADFADGDSTAVVHVWYSTVTLS